MHWIGCIAVSLKKLGGYASVEGADISEEALKVAKRNSEEILENSDVNNDAVSKEDRTNTELHESDK